MRFPCAVGVVVVREEIVAYPPPVSNVAEGMPLIPGSGDRELRLAEWHSEAIAMRHFHSLQSYAASFQASMASFPGCRAINLACRRRSVRTFGSRKSGTQCCTGRNPSARSRARRAAIRRRGPRGELFRVFFGVLTMQGS
jgi:hypothetical protein